LLNQLLDQLSEIKPRCAKSIELHYFAGLKHGEIATVLNVAVPTIRKDLRMGLTWLRQQMQKTGNPDRQGLGPV